MADIDGDGSLDLFVVGQVIHGRYPEASSSLVFRGRPAGKLELDPENTKALARVGLVSGAVFSDLDGDGDADLILACEWGPLKIFRNDAGKLTPWNPQVTFASNAPARTRFETMSQMTGWWNGVTTGDFDGDGRMDIAASNWGRNTRCESFHQGGLRLCYGELFRDGVVQNIEGYTESQSRRLLPLQPFHLMGAVMPAMRERVGTFENYARLTLPEIYLDAWSGVKELQAAWLQSAVFLNRGGSFEVVTLPLEAQMAPAFAVCAGDLDGDGREDLFLSQNFFAVPADHSRYDAGRGLWLRGDGRGGFVPVPGQESGLKIYGEQRGAAVCDYDADGRVDLVVSQNAAQTKLFHNAGARPGLRVRLAGPTGNPSGVGATVRLVSGGKMGPAREIHAGSGYWSQDSAVQVLAGAEPATQLWVRWLGGKTNLVEIPPGAREVAVDEAGRLERIH